MVICMLFRRYRNTIDSISRANFLLFQSFKFLKIFSKLIIDHVKFVGVRYLITSRVEVDKLNLSARSRAWYDTVSMCSLGVEINDYKNAGSREVFRTC